MLNRIATLFKKPDHPLTGPEHHERLQVATCVLLLEIARADDEFTDAERDAIVHLLTKRFSLAHGDAHELLDNAKATRKNSVDLWTFTNQINQACTLEEKIAIIEEIWRVIYADKELGAHEDFLVHRLAKLLNLAHPELIQAKLKVLDEVRGG